MESYKQEFDRDLLADVLRLPRRDGNLRMFWGQLAKPQVLRLPMRDGNPLEELRAAIEAIVLRLPMRDGNPIPTSRIARLE